MSLDHIEIRNGREIFTLYRFRTAERRQFGANGKAIRFLRGALTGSNGIRKLRLFLSEQAMLEFADSRSDHDVLKLVDAAIESGILEWRTTPASYSFHSNVGADPAKRTVSSPAASAQASGAQHQSDESEIGDARSRSDQAPGSTGFMRLIHRAESFVGIPGSRLAVIVDEVNPLDGKNNCGYIIDAVVARLRGTNVNATAPDAQDGSWDQIDARFKIKIDWNQGFQSAFDAVKAGGDGTIAIIGVKYAGGGAHVITMANDRGQVGIVEGQDWGAGQGPQVITTPSDANKRYNPDGGSNIGFAIIPK